MLPLSVSIYGSIPSALTTQFSRVPVGWVRPLKKLAFTHEANLQPLVDQGEKT